MTTDKCLTTSSGRPVADNQRSTNSMPASAAAARDATYELRFANLHDASRALSFPCDAHGRVPMDTLSDRVRSNYLYARAVMGREFAWPRVVPAIQN